MTQCEKLLKALKKRNLTKAQIWSQLGILNAGGRIHELRQYHKIDTHFVKRNGSEVAQYHYIGRK